LTALQVQLDSYFHLGLIRLHSCVIVSSLCLDISSLCLDISCLIWVFECSWARGVLRSLVCRISSCHTNCCICDFLNSPSQLPTCKQQTSRASERMLFILTAFS
jgi:hypothetical protein